MDRDQEYFLQRERIERAAAKCATDARSRRVHQELAEGYATLARNELRLAERRPEGHGPVHFTIIGK